MRFLLAALLLVSFSALANDITKVVDGSAAFCKTKADVLRYQSSGIYRPLKFVRDGETATLTVEFLRCIQKGENFLFVRDDRFENRVLTIEAGPFSRTEQKVVISRSEISAVTYNTRGRVYSNAQLRRNADNTYSQSMPIEMANFEANRDGEHFFEMAISYKVMIKDHISGKIIDSKLEFLGSYRVYVRD